MSEIQQAARRPLACPVAWSLRTMLARRSPGTSRSIRMIGTSTWLRTSSVAGAPFARERQDHPVDAPRLEEPDVGGVEVRVVLGVHQEHRVARSAEHRLGARRDGRDQRVRDVADDVADRQRRPATQALGQEVRLVLELLDGGEDALAHLEADVGVLREDPGDGRDRDVGELGDFAHARALAPDVAPPVDRSSPILRRRRAMSGAVPETLSATVAHGPGPPSWHLGILVRG